MKPYKGFNFKITSNSLKYQKTGSVMKLQNRQKLNTDVAKSRYKMLKIGEIF